MPLSSPLGKTLIGLGIVLVAAGLLMLYGPKIPWLGKLPGDIYIEKGNLKFYFPLATCLLLSGLVSLILYIIRRLWKP